MAALAMVGDTAALPRRRMPYPGPRQHERKLSAHLSARYCADPEQSQSQDVIPIEPGVRADRRYERLAPGACRLASTFGLSSSVRTMPCIRYRHQRGMSAHLRARPRCINMLAGQPAAIAIGACARTTDKAKASDSPARIPAVICGCRLAMPLSLS